MVIAPECEFNCPITTAKKQEKKERNGNVCIRKERGGDTDIGEKGKLPIFTTFFSRVASFLFVTFQSADPVGCRKPL